MAYLRKRGRVWYYTISIAGQNQEFKGCTDERETRRLAAATEVEEARRRAGLADPQAQRYASAERRPLTQHLDDYRRHLEAKGNTPRYVNLFVGRARMLVDLLGAEHFSDLTPSAVQDALSSLREEKSLGTVNHYRAAIRGFSSWAYKDGRTRTDLLAGVSGYNTAEDRRHDRRTLGVDELRRLLEAAEAGPSYRKMSGPARALCYRLAVSTGLRFSEIKSITPGSFSGLEGDEPTVTVQAAYTKNGQEATLPIPPELAEDLRVWLAEAPADQVVFPLPDRGADMLKPDLEAADIPYRDEAGQVFDFHALRCQCATIMDQAGCSPRHVQRLMRHSTLDLTGRYTRPRSQDLRRAVDSIPSLRRPPADAPKDSPTTTDEAQITRINNHLADLLPISPDATGHPETATGGMEAGSLPAGLDPNSLQVAEFGVEWRDLSSDGVNSGGGTRTPDTRIMIPLL